LQQEFNDGFNFGRSKVSLPPILLFSRALSVSTTMKCRTRDFYHDLLELDMKGLRPQEHLVPVLH
jgi:hypothetical protein